MIKDSIINSTIFINCSRKQFIKEVVTDLDTIIFSGTIILISDNHDVALSGDVVKIS